MGTEYFGLALVGDDQPQSVKEVAENRGKIGRCRVSSNGHTLLMGEVDRSAQCLLGQVSIKEYRSCILE